MPLTIALRPADYPSVASAACSNASNSSSSGPSFGDALKSAQNSSDSSTNASDPGPSPAAVKPHAKPARKTKKQEAQTATDGTDTSEETSEETKAEAKSSKHQASDETDESEKSSAGKDAKAGEPKKTHDTDAGLLASQTAVAVVHAAPVKKTIAQPTGGKNDDAGETSEAVLSGLTKPKTGKETTKTAEQPIDAGASRKAADPPHTESPDKDKEQSPDATQPQPLAISKPTKQQQEKAAAAKAPPQAPEPTASSNASNAQNPTPTAASGTSASLATVLSQPPEQQVPSAAHDLSTVQITSSHTSPSQAVSSAEAAPDAQDSQPLNADQTFEQVVLGLHGKIDARNGKAEIQLNPPNLGSVHVSINLDKGSLTAQFQSGSGAVRDLLKGNMEKLKTVLEAHGVSVDKLSVESPVDPAKSGGSQNAGTANHDGRSAGDYTQDHRRKKTDDSGAFAKLWHNNSPDQTPIDLVA